MSMRPKCKVKAAKRRKFKSIVKTMNGDADEVVLRQKRRRSTDPSVGSMIAEETRVNANKSK